MKRAFIPSAAGITGVHRESSKESKLSPHPEKYDGTLRDLTTNPPFFYTFYPLPSALSLPPIVSSTPCCLSPPKAPIVASADLPRVLTPILLTGGDARATGDPTRGRIMARSSTGAAEHTMAQGSRPQEPSLCSLMQISLEKSWLDSAQMGWEGRVEGSQGQIYRGNATARD